ncbi:MAG TPA: type I restriction endonuclease [Pyrinomonadaceae bacterium]|jgi:hypothetical protein
MKINEENIKNNILLPLLQGIGFSAGDLEFESNFTIQLGRGVYTVKGEETKIATGRLDILCRRDGKPLFLIELKAEGEDLTDADRKQGLSYARLLDPMAPYVILSNGQQTLIYETLKGEAINQIARDIVISGYYPSLESEIGLRFEALKHFVGYSYDNLLNFCQSHNQAALEKFRAQPTENIDTQIKKKYIPEAYVRREALESCFEKFIEQDDKCLFAIVGESGTGKTNTICHLVDSSVSEPVLLYSGSLLGSSFLKEISVDFNLDFSPQESEISVLKKISTLAMRYSKSFTVFLDAVDEWEAADKVYQLSQVVNCLKLLRMKFVVSCKPSIWQSFLSRNGIPTTINDSLFPEIPELADFDNAETKDAVTKYEKWLGIIQLDDIFAVGNMNPFGLRVACEVAYADKIPLDLSKESRSTLNRYLKLKLEKSANSDLCLRFLNGMSKCLLDRNQVQLSEESLRSALSLRIYDDIPPDLFNLNILYKYFDDARSTTIGFYFSLLRDYIVALNVLQLDKIENKQRLQVITWNLSTYIGESAVIYFFRTGDDSEQISCIEAAIQYDRDNRKAVLARLLAWNAESLNESVKIKLKEKILKHFKYMFDENKDNLTIANQIIDSVEGLVEVSGIESLLGEFFAMLIKHPGSPFIYVSHRLAALLSDMNDASTTELLISLLSEEPETSYVRRYIIESLENRTVPNRKELFVRLMVDESADVRTYVRSWYPALEDSYLRDELIKIFDDSKRSGVKQDIALTLARSSLHDTGEKLYNRFITHEFSQDLGSWICRSIAMLNYKPAIPAFIKLLKLSPYSDQAGHLLIALGDMHATEAMPALFDMLGKVERKGANIWSTWFTHAFTAIATEEDYRRLEDVASNSKNRYAVFLATLIMAEAGNRQYDAVISKFVTDNSIPTGQREEIFSVWGHSLIGFLKTNGVWYPSSEEPSVSIEVLRSLYSIFEENNEMSSMALGLLINLEPNPKMLYTKIVELLPKLKSHYSSREIPIVSRQRLENLAPLIKPWLNIQIASKSLVEPFIRNCITLVELLGDITTLETISANHARLESLLGKDYLERIEHKIRKSQGEVRLFAD